LGPDVVRDRGIYAGVDGRRIWSERYAAVRKTGADESGKYEQGSEGVSFHAEDVLKV
jgi:hypothetical protein